VGPAQGHQLQGWPRASRPVQDVEPLLAQREEAGPTGGPQQGAALLQAQEEALDPLLAELAGGRLQQAGGGLAVAGGYLQAVHLPDGGQAAATGGEEPPHAGQP
jgi:hypothetical protein